MRSWSILALPLAACTAEIKESNSESLPLTDVDGDGFNITEDGDCNDEDPTINPGVPEVCDGIDNNCDGTTDEGVMLLFYSDVDEDGFGAEEHTIEACEPPDGYVDNAEDCDDLKPEVYPDAPELCDSLDNDCDGEIDEELGTLWYADSDHDTYGDPALSMVSCMDVDGYTTDNTDCDDSEPAVNPAATEICNDTDDDCDGSIDEEAQDASTWFVDADGDRYGGTTAILSCDQPAGTAADSTDCDDAVFAVNPGAMEICNGVDDDCDGTTDEPDAFDASAWYQDADSDGFGDASSATTACTQPLGYVADNTDCNDTDALINPAATELCNGVDDDCDGTIDEPDAVDASAWYRDVDGDAFGDPNTVSYACAEISGYIADNTDCDDTVDSIHPGAEEACNGVDDDCDGSIDEDASLDMATWYMDLDGDSFGNSQITQVSCTQPPGYVLSDTDCDDNNAGINPAATELCNGVDDDCDGTVDESDAQDAGLWYQDTDGDAFGDSSTVISACTQPSGFVADSSDCDDNNAAINPAATELCNSIDDDCDGVVDERDAADAGLWYVDADGDGFGDANSGISDCAQPSGYTSDNTDCNDGEAAINPAATETCNGLDDDCDGVVDPPESFDAVAWYQDGDGDGFGDPNVAINDCAQPSGYTSDNTDCDDTVATTNPAATEYCNGADDDCDGIVDEPDAADAGVWYQDSDGDAFGDASVLVVECSQPSGYVSDSTDCNDADPAINPAADEHCDGVDENCDGLTDNNAIDGTSWYLDTDGDGYGDSASSLVSCVQPSGYVSSPSDCDDGDASIYPGAIEHCDGVDEDCDGSIDDNAVDGTTWYPDNDGDGYGDADSGIVSCTQPSGMIADGSDCDDDNDEIYPGATEICNGVQDDCADTSWTSDNGLATFYNAAGVMSDYSATLSGGTYAAPKSVSLSTNGELYICGGIWYDKFSISATDLSIIGIDRPVLSGADKITVLNLLSTMTLDLYDLDITEGYGCFGSAIAGGRVYSCSSSGASTGHSNVDLSMYDVDIYDNRILLGGGTITLGYATGLYMENTNISDNTGDGIWNINTPVDCVGTAADSGVFANTGYGVWLWDVSSSYSYGITSSSCDFGIGGTDNGYNDIAMVAGSSVGYRYGDNVSFTCSTASMLCY